MGRRLWRLDLFVRGMYCAVRTIHQSTSDPSAMCIIVTEICTQLLGSVRYNTKPPLTAYSEATEHTHNWHREV